MKNKIIATYRSSDHGEIFLVVAEELYTGGNTSPLRHTYKVLRVDGSRWAQTPKVVFWSIIKAHALETAKRYANEGVPA